MRCGIALGSNIGDRLGYLQSAQAALSTLHEGPNAPLFSSIYETEPVGCEPGTAPYLNAVMEIETNLDPASLLRTLQQIEQTAGRPARRPHNTPRTLDLDLLYADDLILDTALLTLPHPRIAQRRFVLQPLADIRPALILPGTGCSVSELLAALPQSPEVKPFNP